MRDRFEVVALLHEIASLLELRGAGRYKVRAFARGARALEAARTPWSELATQERLLELPGIGIALAQQILELRERGTSELLASLREGLPSGVVELSQVGGVGLHALRGLHDLGIASVDDLRAAAEQGRLRDLKGWGEAKERRVLEAIARYEEKAAAIPLADGLRLARELEAEIGAMDGAIAVHLAGALRRFTEIAREAEIVVVTRDASLLDRVARMPRVSRVEERDATHARLRLADGTRLVVTCCSPDELPAVLARALSAPAHYEALRVRAEERGYRLEAAALARNGARVPLRDEAELYAALGLPWIPPEVREGHGEIAAAEAGDPFDLVRLEDIRGYVHCHTTWSDGKHGIEEMARAAEERGASFLTITDHSGTAHYAGGLDSERLKRQWDEIDEVQSRVGIRLLRGTESDILADGALDWPDALLERLDVIIASIHNRYHQSEDAMTERVLRALRLPIFKIWGHPLGRLVPSRPPIPLRVEEVLDALAGSPGAIEINGDPHRLDIEPRWARAARARGIPFVLSVDAHSIRDLDNLRYAVLLARHAGLRARDVLNTRPAGAFARAVRPRESRAG